MFVKAHVTLERVELDFINEGYSFAVTGKALRRTWVKSLDEDRLAGSVRAAKIIFFSEDCWRWCQQL